MVISKAPAITIGIAHRWKRAYGEFLLSQSELLQGLAFLASKANNSICPMVKADIDSVASPGTGMDSRRNDKRRLVFTRKLSDGESEEIPSGSDIMNDVRT